MQKNTSSKQNSSQSKQNTSLPKQNWKTKTKNFFTNVTWWKILLYLGIAIVVVWIIAFVIQLLDPIFKILSQIAGIGSAAANAMNTQINACTKHGYFSSACPLGFLGIAYFAGPALFGLIGQILTQNKGSVPYQNAKFETGKSDAELNDALGLTPENIKATNDQFLEQGYTPEQANALTTAVYTKSATDLATTTVQNNNELSPQQKESRTSTYNENQQEEETQLQEESGMDSEQFYDALDSVPVE